MEQQQATLTEPKDSAEDGGDNAQVLRVVYDPSCDRFFLQDERTLLRNTQRQKSNATSAALGGNTEKEIATTIRWDQWVLPPKSTSKKQRQQQRDQQDSKSRSSMPLALANSIDDGMAALALHQSPTRHQPPHSISPPATNQVEAAAPSTEGLLSLPELDLSSIAATTNVPDSINNAHHPPASSAIDSTAKKQTTTTTTPSAKKARIRSYVAHFASANAILPSAFPDARTDNQGAHEIKWNGEPIRVKVACESNSDYHEDESTSTSSSSNQDDDTNHDDIAIQHLFELPQLLRIRPRPDGFRDANVNSDCTFTPLTSPSSSSSPSSPSSSSSLSDDDSALPVFHKGDRMLFRAKHRRLKGKVARRIKKSSFYDVKAANGTLFLAVSALRPRALAASARRFHDEQERQDIQGARGEAPVAAAL